MDITLPVSLGEALDKLSILQIKLQKISDESRKSDVQKEYDVLYSHLKTYVERWSYYYKLLFEINLDIWELQDKFHGKDISPTEGAEICKKILEENDRRFRVKAKLNHAAASNLREQKGYAKKKVFLHSHLGLGDMFWMNGAVRYLATAYDEVVVLCKNRNRKNVEAMYADDPTIQLLCIEDDNLIPMQQKHELYSILNNNGFAIYRCGYHKDAPRIYEFPHCFYDDLQMNRNIRTRYFHVPHNKESDELYEKVKSVSEKYIVVHQQQSSGNKMAIWDYISKNANCPILDINENHYPQGHPYFEIAEEIVAKPLLSYKKLLENATEIHLLESSLYCFASHLDLTKVEKKCCYNAFDHSNERLGIFSTAAL